MSRIIESDPGVFAQIVLAQSRSIYMRLEVDRMPGPLGKELLHFKYGTSSPVLLQDMLSTFMAESLLELDIMLLHHASIEGRWSGEYAVDRILEALIGHGNEGLRIVIMRHLGSSKVSGEKGHRVGLHVDQEGRYRFYDPRWGEVYCRDHLHFSSWYKDFWAFSGFARQTIRTPPFSPGVRVYTLGDTLSQRAKETALDISKRFRPLVTPDDLARWLGGQPGLLIKSVTS